jgi:alpha,alpha-trehalase
MRAVGFKTAVVTSSKNAQLILETAAITDLFDVRVDGVESAKLGLKGKPEADIFLVAAQHLSVIPARCIVFEDAVAGVQAGRQGSFGLVVGVARNGGGEDLLANGADLVVTNLAQLQFEEEFSDPQLSSALAYIDDIGRALSSVTPAVFLDYDGTLTPIVDRPELALLSAEMREVLKTLAGLCPTAIISGRDLVDVRQMVGLDELYYAGSHGFDIAVPQHTQIEYQEGKAFLPDLTQAAAQLDEALGSIPGCLVERKRFAIAVHYRLVAEQHLDTVSAAVSRIAAQHPRLKHSGGKKIYELRPNLNWDKGKALAWLLKALDLDTLAVLPFYLGDDETDEDAFAAVHERGIGILVAAQPQSSRARYRLADTDEVKSFLKALVSILEKGR